MRLGQLDVETALGAAREAVAAAGGVSLACEENLSKVSTIRTSDIYPTVRLIASRHVIIAS